MEQKRLPGVPWDSLLDWASIFRCRSDTRCICARKAIAWEFSPNALVSFLDAFVRSGYQSDEVFQSELYRVTRSCRVPRRNRFGRRRCYSMKENVPLLKQQDKIIL